MDKVKLIKQSYKEARDSSQVTEGLELICMVSGSSPKVPFTRSAIEEINKQVIEAAEKLGAQYVYGVEYRATAGSTSGGTIGYGDAYKVKK